MQIYLFFIQPASIPDIFVIALGTNDVKQAFNNSEADITAGIDKIINLVLSLPLCVKL